jgi:antitoxin VapB
MGLTIESPEADRLAQELAAATGESAAEAVTAALHERLERVRHERSAGLAERLLAIGRDCASRLKEPYRSADPADLLYDERGLP